jgi:hypothetical protein
MVNITSTRRRIAQCIYNEGPGKIIDADEILRRFRKDLTGIEDAQNILLYLHNEGIIILVGKNGYGLAPRVKPEHIEAIDSGSEKFLTHERYKPNVTLA